MAAAAIAGAIALTILVHPAGLTLIVPILAALWMARPRAQKAGETSVLQQQFAELKIAGPRNWTSDDVGARLRELRGQLADAEVMDRMARQWEAFGRQSAGLAGETKRLDEEADCLRRKYGIAIDQEDGRDASVLYTIEAVVHWHSVAEDAAAARASLATQETRCAACLRAINDRLRDLDIAPVDDVDEARAACDSLGERIRAHDTAAMAANAATNAVMEALLVLRKVRRARVNLLHPRGFAESDIEAFSKHAQLYGEYESARSQWRALRVQRLHLRRRAVQENGLSPRDLRALPAAGQESEMTAAQETARALQRDITEINTLVEHAKKRTDVEAAYSAVQWAQTELASARDGECAAVAGQALLDFVGLQSRDLGRPRVFRRAGDLFEQITQGRYTLEFHDGNPPAFRALDRQHGEPRNLDQLSSGTRVQLLIAVRLAFLQEMETGVRLPIIVDEALANSDDERAAAIVSALFALCRDGRQLFYLTAQADEVDKWRTMLREHGEIPFAVIEMGEL